MKLIGALGVLALTCTGGFAQQFSGYSDAEQQKQKQWEAAWLQTTDFSRFRQHLTQLTSHPHMAGTPANEKVRDYLVSTMQKAGWETQAFPYDILLPRDPGFSAVSLVTPHRIPLNNQEDILPEDPYSGHPDLKPGWNAWSGSGKVTGEVVYANYGTKADFEKLKSLGIDVKGKIVLARYGANFRGYKAKFAEEYGAVGLIIYTDPGDSGYMRGLTYPQGVFYNPSSIQRGSLLTLDFTGDVLTPFEPALPLDGPEKISRKEEERKALPTIPVTSLPYGSVQEIFRNMEGKPVPAGWQGGLPFTYRLTGGSKVTVSLEVQQPREMVRVYNVVGELKGTDLADEWIVLGCHYDAWSFGSTDPNSGTALLLSLAESMQKMAQKGLKTRRSIWIGHWDAEEHGVIGSTEWVEQMKKELQAKAVTYINLDAAVSGRNFGASASPSMKRILLETTQPISFPDSSKSLFDVWKGKKVGEPSMGNLGGGSDHIAFYMHAGIPSLNAGVGGPTLYHTNYDNLHFYEKMVDPSFKMGGMMEQWVGVLAGRLANATYIPYDLQRYPADLAIHLAEATRQIKLFQPTFAGFTRLNKAVESLKVSAKLAEEALETSLLKNSNRNYSKINQRLLSLEKSFLDPKGMEFGRWYQSLYASSDPFSGYASWVLPGLQYEIELKRTSEWQAWEDRYLKAVNQLNQELKELSSSLK